MGRRAEAVERGSGLPNAGGDLQDAVEREYLARSPCRTVRLSKDGRRHVHVVDADELARLAKAMAEYSPMAYLAAVLGLRWGEVAGLRVGRIDLDDRVLVVAEQVTRGMGGRIYLDAPKSDAGRRALAMPATLALLEWPRRVWAVRSARPSCRAQRQGPSSCSTGRDRPSLLRAGRAAARTPPRERAAPRDARRCRAGRRVVPARRSSRSGPVAATAGCS